MNRQDIIAMAIKADLVPDNLWETPELERFAALVAAKERDECAKVCRDKAGTAGYDASTAFYLSGDISARGQQ